MLKILQAGRALAAISVVGFHLSALMAFPQYGNNAVFHEYTKHGDFGVNFFFVLSGFIILFAHEKDIGRPTQWKEYIYRRFIRVFPIYWIYSSVFVALLFLGFGNGASYPHSVPDWASSILLIKFSNVEPPLTPAWTLFHEIGFYLIFSMLLLNRKAGIFLLAAFAIFAAVRFQFPMPVERTPWNVYTAAHNLDFFFGMLAYWLYKHANKWITLGSGIIVFLFASITIPLPHQTSALFFGMAFSLVLAGAVKIEADGGFKVPGWLCFAGDASYSLYLVHIPFQIVLLKIAMKLSILRVAGPQATYVAILILSILCGISAYVLIERPLLSAIKKRRNRKMVAAVA